MRVTWHDGINMLISQTNKEFYAKFASLAMTSLGFQIQVHVGSCNLVIVNALCAISQQLIILTVKDFPYSYECLLFDVKFDFCHPCIQLAILQDQL